MSSGQSNEKKSLLLEMGPPVIIYLTFNNRWKNRIATMSWKLIPTSRYHDGRLWDRKSDKSALFNKACHSSSVYCSMVLSRRPDNLLFVNNQHHRWNQASSIRQRKSRLDRNINDKSLLSRTSCLLPSCWEDCNHSHSCSKPNTIRPTIYNNSFLNKRNAPMLHSLMMDPHYFSTRCIIAKGSTKPTVRCSFH